MRSGYSLHERGQIEIVGFELIRRDDFAICYDDLHTHVCSPRNVKKGAKSGSQAGPRMIEPMACSRLLRLPAG